MVCAADDGNRVAVGFLRGLADVQNTFSELGMLGWILGLGTISTFATAWWYPGTPLSGSLGWTGVLLLCALVLFSKQLYRQTYLTGSAVYSVGFYWLYWTIKDFGGFPSLAALAVFALFIFGQAIQFFLFALFYKHSPAFLRRASLDVPLAWIAGERLWVRIFPWEAGHTQIAFPYLVQIVDIFGSPAVTFMMFWLCTALLRVRRSPGPALLAAGAWIFVIGYGIYCFETIPAQYGPEQEVALIQANVSIQEKHNQRFVVANRDRYKELSSRVAQPGVLVVWPESVIVNPVPELGNVQSLKEILPYSENGSAFLIGALTYNQDREVFNSGVGISHDGTIPPPYHKLILMPFGEYMPFANLFPWLENLNPNVGGFTPGRKVETLGLTTRNSKGETSLTKVTPLVCYEDIVPRLARTAVLDGSQILANLTNDAWFGNTVAPYQHHLIASFRAIENRRFLIRSTNTGLTAVVDPLGRTIGELPPFSEGILQTVVNKLEVRTLYTQWFGELLWQILSYFVALAAVVGFAKKRTART